MLVINLVSNIISLINIMLFRYLEQPTRIKRPSNEYILIKFN